MSASISATSFGRSQPIGWLHISNGDDHATTWTVTTPVASDLMTGSFERRPKKMKVKMALKISPFFRQLLRSCCIVAAAVCALSTFGWRTGAEAQSDAGYPARPVQLIIGYGAGTIGDVSMRIVAKELTAKLGKAFIIENRPGAAGVIAAQAVAMAAPDGYTLLFDREQLCDRHRMVQVPAVQHSQRFCSDLHRCELRFPGRRQEGIAVQIDA